MAQPTQARGARELRPPASDSRRRLLARAAVAPFVIAFGPFPSRADGLSALESFLRGTPGGRAEFTQTVTAPPRDGQPGRTRVSSGVFEFARPDRFRFSYRKPFEQTIVADGQTLWLHDPDLNQVTAREQASALAGSPVGLIASAADLDALRRDFTLQPQPDAEGLQWVLAMPRAAGGPLQSLRAAFRPGGRVPELARLEIVDGFGQRSLITFGAWGAGPGVGSDAFRFRPPPGADLLRQ